jgi:hypothetical protein
VCHILASFVLTGGVINASDLSCVVLAVLSSCG